MTDQVIVLGHAFGGECQGEGDRERQAFGHSHDNDRNSRDEQAQEFLCFALRVLVAVWQACQEFDECDREEKQTSSRTELCDVALKKSVCLK